jgi:hypothetical protein
MVEASKIVPDLENLRFGKIVLVLTEKISKGLKPFLHYRGADAYKFGDDESWYIVLVHETKIVYYVRHRRVSYAGKKLGRQVLLWRDPSAGTVANGFAQKIFFGVLLPQYGALIADKEQTRNGSAFWANAIIGAFARGLHVYCLDRRGKVSLTELKTESDATDHEPTLWGTSPGHLYTFAVISTKPLTLRK